MRSWKKIFMETLHPLNMRFIVFLLPAGEAVWKANQKKMECVHVNFQILDCSLWIRKDFPFPGASLDGVASYDCCCTGVCEINLIFSDL